MHPGIFAVVAAIVLNSACGEPSDGAALGGAGGTQPVLPAGAGGALMAASGGMPSAGAVALPSGGMGGAPITSGGAGGIMSGGADGASGTTGGAGGGTVTEPDAGMDTACDRACLIELTTAYLAALVARDASSLPLAASVRFTENGKELALTEGLWAVASSLSAYRQDFAEVPAGQSASFVKLEDDQSTVLLAVRLKVVAGEITEIETLVCREGEATFFAPESLATADPIYDSALEAGARMSREELIEIVDLYFQGLEAGDGSGIPFGAGASRTENGVVTASGARISNLSAFSYIDQIKRRYVLVDEERGVVLPFALFEIPSGLSGSRTLHIAELFKVSGGDIMKIDAVMVNQAFGTTSGWE
jgi:hypothetical protein